MREQNDEQAIEYQISKVLTRTFTYSLCYKLTDQHVMLSLYSDLIRSTTMLSLCPVCTHSWRHKTLPLMQYAITESKHPFIHWLSNPFRHYLMSYTCIHVGTRDTLFRCIKGVAMSDITTRRTYIFPRNSRCYKFTTLAHKNPMITLRKLL